MEYQNENRICQNCKGDFIIETEDFSFYEKVKVPPPTFCPECRRQRRFSFRNTHCLYKRKSSNDGKELISIYSPDKNFVVYDNKYWWSDAWDPMDYCKEYDFDKPFFQQWRELRDIFPLQALSNSKAVSSDYCNVAEENYDCYLITACYRNERTMYSDSISYIKDSMDLHIVHKSEFCYDDINCAESYKLFYSEDSFASTDSYFLYDCRGCVNSFMCSNLRNKSYCFFNEQLSREEYAEKLAEYDLGKRSTITALKKQFEKMKLSALHRYAMIINSHNSTGDNIIHGKNAKMCFYTTDGTEDCKFMFWGAMNTKNSYDTDACAEIELGYDSFDVGVGGNRNLFVNVVYSSTNVEYCINCYSCNDCFGCIGLRSKSYCIFNKQYSKEEYKILREKIIEHMQTMPYIDAVGIAYTYGEFFPAELSPFAYNETVASDYTSLSKEQVLAKGFRWKEKEAREYKITIPNEEIEDDIKNVHDQIIDEVLECRHKGQCNDRCTSAFKITKNELIFYKRFGIPLPDLCYWCRHKQRFNSRRPLKLWHRSCMCEKTGHTHEGKCEVEFETSYGTERPEIVYCEKCYQQEVY